MGGEEGSNVVAITFARDQGIMHKSSRLIQVPLLLSLRLPPKRNSIVWLKRKVVFV